MRILAVEPYFGLSHESFLEGYRTHSRHSVELWTLPPRKWKWRMRGSAFHFAERMEASGDSDDGPPFDAILASDFLNLPDFLALARHRLGTIPAIAYFHENQITYPLGEHAPADYHYGWINVSTALSADRILFNSQYHRGEFLGSIREVFDRMPDHVPDVLLRRLVDRSGVFPVGIDFAEHDCALRGVPRQESRTPVILWNHRWEYDKGPDLFFDVLVRLREEGVDFRLVVCGQSFKNRPPVFAEMKKKFADRIDHFGFFPSRDDYLAAVRQCDVVVSTAVHEFFGVSVAEAVYLGCLPVLPKRLSYPEIIPPHLHPIFLYDGDEDLAAFLGAFLREPPVEYRQELRRAVTRFHWRELAPTLDREFEAVVAAGKCSKPR